VLEQVLCTAPAVVISELSGQVVDEATVGLLRKLRPLSPPVKEGYLDVLEKLKLPEPRALLGPPVGMGGTASWMIFEFPTFLLRFVLPPLKWSSLRYVFAMKEDDDGEEETHGGRDRCEAAAG
jgi:hypothetical protein